MCTHFYSVTPSRTTFKAPAYQVLSFRHFCGFFVIAFLVSSSTPNSTESRMILCEDKIASSSLAKDGKRFKGVRQVAAATNLPDSLLELDRLPDLCLLTILEHLPLIDLLRVGRVNRRWRRLQAYVRRHTVRSVRLFSYCNYSYRNQAPNENVREKLDLVRFFELELSRMDLIVGVEMSVFRHWLLPNQSPRQQQLRAAIQRRFPLIDCSRAAERLCASFPTITELVIFDCRLSGEEVARLLDRWRSTLRRVTIAIVRLEFEWAPVLRTLNQLVALEHLRLYVVSGLVWKEDRAAISTVMRRLKTFYFGYHDYYFGLGRTWIAQLFAQLNPAVLERAGVGFFSAHTHSGSFVRHNLSLLGRNCPQVAARLDTIKCPQMQSQFLPFLVARFGSSLRVIDIVFADLTPLFKLSGCPNLTRLTLRSNLRPYSRSPLDSAPEWQLILLPYIDQVERLVLLDFTLRDEIWHYIFPNASIVRLTRGDQNAVDLPKTEDLINFNRLNWRRINRHNFDQIVEPELVRAAGLLPRQP